MLKKKWKGYEEMGIKGRNDLRVKVGEEGGKWSEDLSVEREKGNVEIG